MAAPSDAAKANAPRAPEAEVPRRVIRVSGGKGVGVYFWPEARLRIVDGRQDTYELYHDDYGYISSSLTFGAAVELGDLVANAQRAAAGISQGSARLVNAGRVAVIETLIRALRPTQGIFPLRLTT